MNIFFPLFKTDADTCGKNMDLLGEGLSLTNFWLVRSYICVVDKCRTCFLWCDKKLQKNIFFILKSFFQNICCHTIGYIYCIDLFVNKSI